MRVSAAESVSGSIRKHACALPTLHPKHSNGRGATIRLRLRLRLTHMLKLRLRLRLRRRLVFSVGQGRLADWHNGCNIWHDHSMPVRPGSALAQVELWA